MTDDPLLRRLLQEALDSDRTPEEVCRDRPDALAEVRRRWERVQGVGAQLEALFPTPGSTRDDGVTACDDDGGLPIIDGYEIDAVLGRGGMGVVYRARHRKLNRLVALKMMLPGAYAASQERSRFQREAEAVAGLSHPNIVPVYDIGESQGRPYFTMELIAGGSLAHQLAGIPLPARAAAELLASVAGAVGLAHAQGIVHRDLKPANVLMTADGTPKVSDFGLARPVDGGPGITVVGTRVGTPSYMAPEQALGRLTATRPAVDVYALGAVLYECLTGRPPFRGETAADTERQVVADDPVPPSRLNPGTPRDLETICLKCLEKDPARRYASAGAVADELRRFLDGRPIVARPAGRWERVGRWCRRHPREAAFAGLLILLTVSTGVGGWWLDRQRLAGRAERAEHARRTRQGVEGAIDQAKAMRSRARWAEAHDSLETASLLAGADGPHDLTARVEAARRDLRTAAEFDRILQASGLIVDGNLDEASAPPAYARAFREYGAVVTEEDPTEAVALIRTSEIKQELIDALDHWMFVEKDAAVQRRLASLARAADPDPWRDRVRDPAVWNDADALRAMAIAARVDEQPVRLLVALGERLPWTEGSPLPARVAGAVGIAGSPRVGSLLAVGTSLQPAYDATEFLRRVQREHPDDFWANFALGFAIVARDPAEASGYFRAALAVRPQSIAAANNLGLALRDLGRSDEAIDCLERALRRDPAEPLLHHNLGHALARAGRSDEAVARYREALRLNPTFGATHNNLAVQLDAGGQANEALVHYRQAARFRPDDPRMHINLGTALGMKGRTQEAITHYREALRLVPGKAAVHLNLGVLLQRQGHLEEAVEQYERALRLDPRLAAAHENLGTVRLGQHQWDRAADHFLAALRLDPKLASARYGLGNALRSMGRVPEAIEEYRHALRLDPDLAAAHINLANALRDTGRPPEAVDHYRHAVRIEPSNANAHGGLGQVLLALGRLSDARSASRRCLDLLAADDPRRAMAVQQLRACDELLALEVRLPAILRGEDKGAEATQLWELARLCQHRKDFAASARLAADAFAADPRLAEEVTAARRYNAACAAACAGGGHGEGATRLDTPERARWREKSRQWLRADLVIWEQRARRDEAVIPLMRQTLAHWRTDPDLAGLRDREELDRLPEKERSECRALWSQVDGLFARSPGTK